MKSTNTSPDFANAKTARVAKNSAASDVTQVLKDLNILREMWSDLQCRLCPYKAIQRGNHYKLMHLGGADLTKTLSLVSEKAYNERQLWKALAVNSQSVQIGHFEADQLGNLVFVMTYKILNRFNALTVWRIFQNVPLPGCKNSMLMRALWIGALSWWKTFPE